MAYTNASIILYYIVHPCLEECVYAVKKETHIKCRERALCVLDVVRIREDELIIALPLCRCVPDLCEKEQCQLCILMHYSSFDCVFLRHDYEQSEESDDSENETKNLGDGEKNMQAKIEQSSADQGTTSSVTKETS